jgi:hypothetical protein
MKEKDSGEKRQQVEFNSKLYLKQKNKKRLFFEKIRGIF